MSSPPDLRILTFNLWGLLWVSKHRRQRIEAFGEILCGATTHSPGSSRGSHSSANEMLLGSQPEALRTGCPWDIVVLQECWVYSDAVHLQAKAKEGGLHHARYYFSGAIGSGLMILSRYPILTSRVLPYPLNGHPLHVIEGDFFAGKGVGSATVDLGLGRGLAEILVTHLFAPGGESPAHRLAQVWEVANLARSAAEKGRHVFLCGDLNSMPDSLTIQFLIGHGQLYDAWAVTHPHPPAHSTPPTPHEAVKLHGVTCDSPLCSWTAGKHLGDFAQRNKGKRLDYILYRSSALPNHEMACTECAVTVMDYVAGQTFSVSDHFAVEARFLFQSAATALGIPPPKPMPHAVYSDAQTALRNQLHATRVESKNQLLIFVTSVVIGIPGIAVAASFQPLQYLNWIFVLLGVAVGWLGTTFLYTGFIAGRWADGALKNVIEELEAWRKGLVPA